jgi:hypothetical protein
MRVRYRLNLFWEIWEKAPGAKEKFAVVKQSRNG